MLKEGILPFAPSQEIHTFLETNLKEK